MAGRVAACPRPLARLPRERLRAPSLLQARRSRARRSPRRRHHLSDAGRLEPLSAIYTPQTNRHWHYVGKPAIQYWPCEKPSADLRCAVNGRFVYWASTAPIPGGIAFENFELIQPFQQGQEVWFGVEPKPAPQPSPSER